MALQLYRKRKTEAMQGRKLPETLRSKPITFNEIADQAMEWAKAHKGTWAHDVTQAALLREWFGPRAAAEVGPRELDQKLRAEMQARGWAPATVNRYKATMSLIYRVAVNNGLVEVNPARLVRQLRADNARIRFLSQDEEARLREAITTDCPQHMHELDLALNTGMRAGEQFGMCWEDVDFERAQIRLGKTKNGRVRHIRLNAPALAALLALRRPSAGSGPVFVNAVTPGRYHGQPRASARNWFERVVRKVAIPDFTWHCLRHTFASRLVMAGVDIRTVAELMGHRTLAMTMRYTHLSPDHNLEAVERLARFGSGPTGTRTGTGTSAPTEAAGDGNAQVACIQ
ncbi:MAG TPA: site-specific integrase [Terriglobales bacterium]|nr:site-specific integrase [Terriglobales bacterium]